MIKCFLFVLICLICKKTTGDSNSTVNPTTLSHPCNARLYVDYWEKENFPNPQKDTELDHCGRNCRKSWICDPDNVISYSEGNELDRLIDQIKQDETRICPDCAPRADLYSISIAIVAQISSKNLTSTEISQSATDFANYLREQKWRFSSNENDIVILLSRKEQEIWLSVGSVSRRVLSNGCLERIKYETKQKIENERYSDALNHMVFKLGRVFKTHICVTTDFASTIELAVPTEAIIAALGVLTVLVGSGAYMVKKDYDKKEQMENKMNPKRTKKRKLSLKTIRARRESQMKNQTTNEENNTCVKIVITNEDGLDATQIEMEEFDKETVKLNENV